MIFKTYPHAICKSRNIKRELLRLKKKKITYAESTRNTKINFITTRKTITPINERTNVIVSAKCLCGNKHKFTIAKFNETGHIAANRRILTKHAKCLINNHAFKKANFHNGLAYRKQTDYMLRYIKWKYRGVAVSNEFSMPNFHFAKIMSRTFKKK